MSASQGRRGGAERPLNRGRLSGLSLTRPGEALVLWLGRYTELLGAKRGLASALHSSEATLEALGAYSLGA